MTGNGFNQSRGSKGLFFTLWLFIIFVSVVDGYLVLRHRGHILELNPQGRALIALNGGRVWLLLTAKFLGTVVACAVLLRLHHSHPHWGTVIVTVLAGLQFCLLLFLVLA